MLYYNDINYFYIADEQNKTVQYTTEKSLFEMAENLTNTKRPNLLINLFDRKLSDEMLSIKENSYGRDASKKCTSTKHNGSDPTLEIKQMWPAVDLLSKVDEIDKNGRGGKSFELQQLLPKMNDDTSAHLGLSAIDINTSNDIARQYNESNNKVVDLRSLSGHAPSYLHDLRVGLPTINSCTCSPSSVNPNWATPQPSAHHVTPYPGASTPPHRCADCTRTTISITLLPYYIPSQPAFYYPPNIYQHPPQYLYYDDNDDEKDDNHCDHDHDHHKETTKKKKDRHPKDYVVDIDYDVPREPEVKWNTAFFEARPNKLVKDLIDDLIKLFPDSVIKKCYCSSSSNHSCTTVFQILLLLFIDGVIA